MTGIITISVVNPCTVREDLMKVLKNQVGYGYDYFELIIKRRTSQSIETIIGDDTTVLMSTLIKSICSGDFVLLRHSFSKINNVIRGPKCNVGQIHSLFFTDNRIPDHLLEKDPILSSDVNARAMWASMENDAMVFFTYDTSNVYVMFKTKMFGFTMNSNHIFCVKEFPQERITICDQIIYKYDLNTGHRFRMY